MRAEIKSPRKQVERDFLAPPWTASQSQLQTSVDLSLSNLESLPASIAEALVLLRLINTT